jgi:hypothetical protein
MEAESSSVYLVPVYSFALKIVTSGSPEMLVSVYIFILKIYTAGSIETLVPIYSSALNTEAASFSEAFLSIPYIEDGDNNLLGRLVHI